MVIETVAVIGAGTMGRGIAHVFALKGYPVVLVDVDDQPLAKAVETIETNLRRQVKNKKITDADQAKALKRLNTSTDLSQAVQTSGLVIEAVPEKRQIKKQVLQAADRAAPAETVLASNTSSISITWLAAQTQRPERFIGMHFFNPVPVMGLVEVVRGHMTSQKVYEAAARLVEDLDKVAVEVKDFPGFVSNRVLMPMINEAIFCLMEGVASAKAIDQVMKLGTAQPMGPLAVADFIGLDVCLSIMEVLHEDLGEDKYRPCPLLRRMVDAGQLGRKTGQGFHVYDG